MGGGISDRIGKYGFAGVNGVKGDTMGDGVKGGVMGDEVEGVVGEK